MLNVFNTLILFEKRKPFSKIWSTVFLVGSTKNENATYPYKPALLETSVKTNRMGSTK